MTIKQASESGWLFGTFDASEHPYEVGKNYILRTVTMIDVGRLVWVGNQELVLEDAAWIADTGRFEECLKKGTLNEVEPFPDGRVIIGRGAIADGCIWNHPLPRVAK